MSMLVPVESFTIQGGDGGGDRALLAFGSRPEGAKWLLERGHPGGFYGPVWSPCGSLLVPVELARPPPC